MLESGSDGAHSIRFFDSNCMIGRHNIFRPGSFHSKDRLLEEMGYYGISDALVFHSVAMENSPRMGNELAVEETFGAPCLRPSWSFMPPVTGETDPPEAFVREMRKHGVKVLRLFPSQYHFDFDDRSLGESLRLFSELRIPIIVDYAESTMSQVDLADWKSVVETCQTYPDLPVIVTEFRFRTNRRLYQALESCPNLRVELSALWLFRSVEDICRRFGAERILFGTRMPIRDPSCALGMVNYAMVSEEEKRMVAGDNLRRLMEGVRNG
ncbi:MAG: amidohydrolase family protein [Candidatus Brockarchaeota archaeon]|nr:amidohydrolase family protein [Candidatus Brockarchaeota archaeon]